MSKEVFEVSVFKTGTVLVLDDRDLPDDACTYSENIDPTEISRLRGRYRDMLIDSPFGSIVISDVSVIDPGGTSGGA